MATTNIDTSSAGYQNRLTQIQEIKAFYGPIIVSYLDTHIKDPDGAKAWRQADPLLTELLQIYLQISRRIGRENLD